MIKNRVKESKGKIARDVKSHLALIKRNQQALIQKSHEERDKKILEYVKIKEKLQELKDKSLNKFSKSEPRLRPIIQQGREEDSQLVSSFLEDRLKHSLTSRVPRENSQDILRKRYLPSLRKNLELRLLRERIAENSRKKKAIKRITLESLLSGVTH